jgi:hypothetical protein
MQSVMSALLNQRLLIGRVPHQARAHLNASSYGTLQAQYRSMMMKILPEPVEVHTMRSVADGDRRLRWEQLLVQVWQMSSLGSLYHRSCWVARPRFKYGAPLSGRLGPAQWL